MEPDDKRVGGIDPELLHETGRASAAQSILDEVEQKGKLFGDRAAALEQVTRQQLELDNKRLRRNWRLAKVALAVLIGIGLVNLQTNRDNQRIITRLDHNQAGVDELVAFVHDLQAQQASSSNGTSDVVKTIERLLCSSTDVARQMACVRLDINPVEVP